MKEKIIASVKGGSIFRMVECEIHVPDNKKSDFAEMTMIFKNFEISRDDIGELRKAPASNLFSNIGEKVCNAPCNDDRDANEFTSIKSNTMTFFGGGRKYHLRPDTLKQGQARRCSFSQW